MRPIDLPAARRFEHGTRARYVTGCRCAPCTAANVARYHKRQAEMRAAAGTVTPSGPPAVKVLMRAGVAHRVKTCPGVNGAPCVAGGTWLRNGGPVCRICVERATVWDGLVDAAPAREHLRGLSELGVGYKSVAAAAGVATSIVAAVMSGKKSQLRRKTADRITSVDPSAIADGAKVAAKPTWALVRELRRWGMSKAAISRAIGRGHLALQLGRRQVLASSAFAIEKLHRAVSAERARPEDCEYCVQVDRCRSERRFPGALCLLAREEAAA